MKQVRLIVGYAACCMFFGPATAPVHAQQPKLTIAVLTIRNTTGITTGEAEVISDRLRNDLFRTGLVEIMERDQMQAILKEQGFQQSGACTDEGCLVELGQLLGVKRLVTGSLGKLGSMYLLNLRVVDVQTAKIINVVSEDIKGDIEDLVDVLPGVSEQLVGAKKRPVRVVEAKPEAKEEVEEKEVKEEPVSPPPKMKVVRGGKIYLEAMTFPKSQLGFGLTSSETNDVNALLLAAFDGILKKKAYLAPGDRLAELAGGDALIIRLTLDSYKTEEAMMSQKEGTAKVTVAFYQGPSSTKPAYSIRISRTGERHWGDSTPFANAFEAIAEGVSDELKRNAFIKSFNKK